MKQVLLSKLVSLLLTLLSPELLKSFADQVLDWVEETIVGTKSTVDDSIVLPLCDIIRRAFDIKE